MNFSFFFIFFFFLGGLVLDDVVGVQGRNGVRVLGKLLSSYILSSVSAF